MGTVMYDPMNDERFQNPFIDVDEKRERELVDGRVVTYRYVHGGFEGTTVKFSFFFPEKEAYRGRFQHYLCPFPGPDEEMASIGRTGENDRIAFALSCGAYFVETNMGSASAFGGYADPTMNYKSSAAAAEYSRKVAMEMYGCGRPYGYVYGGSGGGYKTMACIENTNAWDGAAPYVIGSPASLPNTICMHAKGQRVLRNCFDKILDALDAGGSGNPYEKLDEDEAQCLKELTRMGFPPIAWYLEAKGEIDDGSLPVLTPGVKMADPSYFQEFWTFPGYEGNDPDSSACKDRLQFTGIVKGVNRPGVREERAAEDGQNGVDDAWKKSLTSGNGAWIELEELPEEPRNGKDLYLKGVNITPEEGEAAGKTLLLDKMIRKPGEKGGYLTIGMCYGMADLDSVLASIQPGMKITLDNSDYIAIQSYYRAQMPESTAFHAWDQFRNEDGSAAVPQRSFVMGPGFTGTGTVQDGNIQGKVILNQALMDESTCPWCADWYKGEITKQGKADQFRLYYNERCMHGDTDARVNYMVVNYMGILRQSLIDLAKWVEEGIEPVPSTSYVLGTDNQIHPETDIAKRYGLQAQVSITANGQKCAQVKCGEAVCFDICAEVPAYAGEITEMVMTCEELEDVITDEMYPVVLDFEKTDLGNGLRGAKASYTAAYNKPGTYYAVVRILSNRNVDPVNGYTQMKNLERVRIVVS